MLFGWSLQKSFRIYSSLVPLKSKYTSTHRRKLMANSHAFSIKCGVQCENVTHLPSVGQVFVRGLHLFQLGLRVRVI